MKCRHCKAELTLRFIDLGTAPPSNAYLSLEQLKALEKWFPLRVLVCTNCWLAQTEDYAGAEELFAPDYAYFSSYSTTWLAHAKEYVAKIAERFNLNRNSMVVEIAANDGYLLQYVKERGIPCYGVEPTASTAVAARAKGIYIIEEFFGVSLAERLAKDGRQADLIIANNVLAHVPDINGFVSGFARLLKPRGVATFEFPHLLRMVAESQFDTIYHEHYSYLSLTAVDSILRANGIEVFDVEEIPTHGGSLRVYAQRKATGKNPIHNRVAGVLFDEADAGISSADYYQVFQTKANQIKNDFLVFLIQAWSSGKQVIGYGAAAKGNTLLNFAGVKCDLIPYVVDRNPAKQGLFLPGSRIPIEHPDKIRQTKPEYVFILPWNIKEEVMEQMSFIREWGGKFVIAVPDVQVL
ncbi:MAG: class I SAM-dependent methyltransferase [Deltaproteobacteria bacterium]|nr:class I SAM-dependent methyltransferase [Deltaproteobacteria bacterium]